MTSSHDDLRWTEARRRDCTRLFEALEEAEIEQFAQYDEVCPSCHTVRYGILDESKTTMPLTGFRDYLTKVVVRYVEIPPVMTERGIMTHVISRESFLPSFFYEIRQDIVRSGLFSRAQLSGLGFTQHELEVNDRSFTYLRPARCDCDFGSEPELTEEELLILAMCEHDDNIGTLAGVETDFIAGKPVRTGYRRRSTAARIARAERRREKKTLVVKPVSRTDCPLSEVSSDPVTLRFRYKVPKTFSHMGGPRVVRKDRRKPINRCVLRTFIREPAPDHRKYFYFRRRYGVCYISKHHPYGDESSLYGNAFAGLHRSVRHKK